MLALITITTFGLATLATATSPSCGCVSSDSRRFAIAVQNVSSVGPSVQRRAHEPEAQLSILLQNGVLTDAQGRTGYTASNAQFQFDAPPQTNAIATSGFAICGNGSLTLGNQAVWYQCLSGNFYNLYSANIDPHACTPVYINAFDTSGSIIVPAACSGGNAGAQNPASEIPDGQVQGPAGAVVSQIPDGQIQAPTGGASVPPPPPPSPSTPSTPPSPGVSAPSTLPPSGQTPLFPLAPNVGVPVSQISDGQLQVPTPGAPGASNPPTTPSSPGSPSSPGTPNSPSSPSSPSVPGASGVPNSPGAPIGPSASVPPPAAAPPASSSPAPSSGGASQISMTATGTSPTIGQPSPGFPTGLPVMAGAPVAHATSRCALLLALATAVAFALKAVL